MDSEELAEDDVTVTSVKHYDDEITSVRIILGAEDPKLGGRHKLQPFGVLESRLKMKGARNRGESG